MNPLVMLFVLVGKGEGVENGDEESQKSDHEVQQILKTFCIDCFDAKHKWCAAKDR